MSKQMVSDARLYLLTLPPVAYDNEATRTEIASMAKELLDARRDLAASEQRVAELDWQTIETAPKDRKVDLWRAASSDGCGELVQGCHYSTCWDGFVQGFGPCVPGATHWREVPAGPIAAQRQKEGE